MTSMVPTALLVVLTAVWTWTICLPKCLAGRRLASEGALALTVQVGILDIYIANTGDTLLMLFSGAGPSRRKPARGADTIVEYEVTLEEAYKGKRVVMGLERDRVCSHCSGSGARNGIRPGKCKTCDGKGSVIADRHVSC